MFPVEFTGLPNLHVNVHLVQHAQNFGTLVNTAVAVKEMMHRIHKARVPRLNCKAVELDLMRRENTEETIRHLVDGWQDPRFSMTFGLKKLVDDPLLHSVLSGWHVTESSSPVLVNEEQEDDGKYLCKGFF